MITVRLGDLQLGTFGYENDPATRVNGTFPMSAATGNKSTAMVYFEVEPGNQLGTHTDSAEELLLILSGSGEAHVGDEYGSVSAGDVALVPAMVPHGIRNVGDDMLRVVGFFSSSTNMATFEQPLLLFNAPAPAESPFGERTVLAPMPIQLEQASVPAEAAI